MHRLVPAGLASVALGLRVFSFIGVDTVIWWMYVPVLFSGRGMALTMTPLTTLIMSAVPLRQAGVGSAMNDTTRELGGALGVAVLGSLVTSTYTASIGDAVAGPRPDATRRLAESGLAGALDVASRLGAAGVADRRRRQARPSSTASAWPPSPVRRGRRPRCHRQARLLPRPVTRPELADEQGLLDVDDLAALEPATA